MTKDIQELNADLPAGFRIEAQTVDDSKSHYEQQQGLRHGCENEWLTMMSCAHWGEMS